jgi:hypothetical protein
MAENESVKSGEMPSGLIKVSSEFNEMLPRSIFIQPTIRSKSADFSGGMTQSDLGFSNSTMTNMFMNPSRRFYDPRYTATSMYLPRSSKDKNMWNRWFYDHDALIGAVLDLHAELPHSQAEFLTDDSMINKHINDCVDRVNLFAQMPQIDLEYLKIGEVFIHTPWNDKLGMWEDIIIHNPDYIEVTFSPFAERESLIELVPSDELKKIIYSTKPEDQALKKRIPKEIMKRVLTGKNILLNNKEVTHIARKSNPYDERGSSILQRIYRDLMLEDKYREFQQTTADSLMFPLKIFKLGDKQKGWIPNKEHQESLAQMLSQANMDPNFSLIYHYGLEVEAFSVVDKLYKLDTEWEKIDKRKMTALGVSQAFIDGTNTYASANVGLQTQLARYKAKRDLFETKWLQDKFFKVMAERNEWYTRDKREIVGQFRSKRTAEELKDRLILPKIVWFKKLMMRDDQSYLNFLNNVYASGKGPISTITLLMQMGLNLEEELTNKKKQRGIEDRIGEYIHPPVEKAAFDSSASKIAEKTEKKGFFDKFKIGKDKVEVKQIEEPKSENLIDTETLKKELEKVNVYDRLDDKPEIMPAKKDFVGQQGNKIKFLDKEEVLEREKTDDIESTREVNLVDNNEWYKNIQSPNISSEVILLLTSYIKKLTNILKKYDNFSEGVNTEKNDIIKLLSDLYLQGKLTSYSHTNYLPIQKEVYSNEIQDYSDMFLFNEFEEWISQLSKIDVTKDSLFKIFRDLSNTCYSYGQLKGFKEQGIENAKVFNVLKNEGLQYPVNKLLNKGWNLSNVISPSSEIIILIPCIEGYENSSLDPYIKKQINMLIDGIDIKNCPIEHAAFFEKFINKFGKYIKKKYATISFVNDCIDLKEWEQDAIERYTKTSSDNAIIQNKILIERTQKIGSVPSFKNGKNLFISNWIFKNESLITGSLLNLIDIYDEIEKPVNKIFKEASYDLSQDELSTYRLLNYVEPIEDDKQNIYSWKISDFIPKDADYRLINGQVWDVKGKCANKNRNPMQIFNENVRLWLFYPQRLNESIKQFFEQL